jgi:menaquinone-dependent protoporphyrinogen oxidase
MKILVAFASRHGSTSEIADALAQELRVAGHSVAVRQADEVKELGGYEAAVIGSALYMGDWLPEARRFVEDNRETLATIPVWLFSSGPLGPDDPQPHSDPAHLDAMMRATGARGHRLFIGKLDRSSLGFGERLIAKVVKAPEGDFRDWEAIRSWAREIAMAVPTLATPEI